MKRDVWVAVIYGVVSGVVGVLLITRGVPRKAGDATEAGEAHWEPREGFGDSAWTRRGQPAHRDDGGALEIEVGPDGLRWVPVRADGPSGGGMPLNGEGRIEVGGGVAAGGGTEEGRPGLLPESGRKLLALGDPHVRAVAEVLMEAGATEEDLEFSLRGIYGHVQRLATFKMLARMNAERAMALERNPSAHDSTDVSVMPTLQWRAEVWQRRSHEYAAYLRRDLETRLGIEGSAVVERMVGIADAMSGQSPPAVPPTVSGSEDPAR